MPMIDIYAPEGALRREAEAALVERLTDRLIAWEGFDPNGEMRDVTWVFVHHPTVYVAGSPASAPFYKVVVTVPEGQLDERARNGVVADVTEAILDAEEGARPREASRVWVFPTEIPDGWWGGRGKITRLEEILSRTMETDQAKTVAAKRIAASRAERA